MLAMPEAVVAARGEGKMKDTSGPAFPNLQWNADLQQMHPAGGLSHREWLAGLAMVGLIINPATVTVQCPLSARAHEIADNMIAFEQQEQGNE